MAQCVGVLARCTDCNAVIFCPSFSRHQNATRIRILAVATAKRLPSLPEVPTMEETGVKDFQVGTWVAMVAPRGGVRQLGVRYSVGDSALIVYACVCMPA